MAVKHSHYLIADNMGIHDYYKEKYGKFVLNEVLEAGNFGKHDERNRFGKSQLGHDLQRVYRDIRLVRYFPGEALCKPLFHTWHFFWKLKYKK